MPAASALRLDSSNLAIYQPLEPAVKQDGGGVLAGKCGDGGASRVAIFLRPIGPDPQAGIGSMQILVERAIHGVNPQELTFTRDPLQALGAGRICFENAFKGPALERCYLFVFNGGGLAEAFEFGGIFGRLVTIDAFNIEIEKIAIENTVRQVGTGVERPAIVNCVEKVQRDEIDSKGGDRPIVQIAQVAEIAATPVTAGPEPVERDAETSVAA